MMAREWKAGDVAILCIVGREHVALRDSSGGWSIGDAQVWRYLPDSTPSPRREVVRPLAVIDPENREQVERLTGLFYAERSKGDRGVIAGGHVDAMQAALREFAGPQIEPTDPKARVADRRDNIWRLLADGDWVCTSGPDIGEYLAWQHLAAERGPLSIEDVTS